MSHSRGGPRGPVLLHPAELHRTRYRKKRKKVIIVLPAGTRGTCFSFCWIEKVAPVWSLIQRLKLSEKKRAHKEVKHLESCSPTPQGRRSFSFLYPRPKCQTRLLQPLKLRANSELKKIKETSTVNDTFLFSRLESGGARLLLQSLIVARWNNRGSVLFTERCSGTSRRL